MNSITLRSILARGGVVAVAALVLLAGTAGVALAQEARAGGVVVVAAGETIPQDLLVTGGTVVVDGTVEGDLTVIAGSAVVDGTVTGDLVVTAGSASVGGTVDGVATVAGGSFVLAETGTVGGLAVGAGDVRVDGTVGGDATVGAGELSVGPTARIDGELRHDADSIAVAPAATVAGGVVRDESIVVTTPAVEGVPAVPAWIGAVYGLLVNALLGVVLLAVAPRFGRRVAVVGVTRTVRAGGAGLLVLVGVPIVLLVTLLTIVGIPLSLAGFVAFLVVLWVASVYGAYAVGTWLVTAVAARRAPDGAGVDVDADADATVDAADAADATDTAVGADAAVPNRWLALAVGLVVVALTTAIPVIGGLVGFLVLLLGLGAFALALRGESGRDGGADPVADEAGRQAA